MRARPFLLTVLAVLVGACGETGGNLIGVPTNGAPTTGAAGPGYMVQASKVKNLGTVLVDGYGLTLYLFVPDHQSGRSTCSGYCATQWPPATLPEGVTTPVIGPGVDKSLGLIPPLGHSRSQCRTVSADHDDHTRRAHGRGSNCSGVRSGCRFASAPGSGYCWWPDFLAIGDVIRYAGNLFMA